MLIERVLEVVTGGVGNNRVSNVKRVRRKFRVCVCVSPIVQRWRAGRAKRRVVRRWQSRDVGGDVHRLRQRVEHLVARAIRIGHKQPTGVDDTTQRVIRRWRAAGATSVKRGRGCGSQKKQLPRKCRRALVQRGSRQRRLATQLHASFRHRTRQTVAVCA